MNYIRFVEEIAYSSSFLAAFLNTLKLSGFGRRGSPAKKIPAFRKHRRAAHIRARMPPHLIVYIVYILW